MRRILIESRGSLSQKEVSTRLGISQKHLSAIELGTRNPSIKLMKKFEEVYEKKMDELFPDIFLH